MMDKEFIVVLPDRTITLHKLVVQYIKLQEETKHWRGNHDNVVKKKRFISKKYGETLTALNKVTEAAMRFLQEQPTAPGPYYRFNDEYYAAKAALEETLGIKTNFVTIETSTKT